METSHPQASSLKGSHHRYRAACVGKVLVAASAKDEAGSRIGKVQLAAPFAVVRNVAVVAFLSS